MKVTYSEVLINYFAFSHLSMLKNDEILLSIPNSYNKINLERSENNLVLIRNILPKFEHIHKKKTVQKCVVSFVTKYRFFFLGYLFEVLKKIWLLDWIPTYLF